jgi:hypothetical protein
MAWASVVTTLFLFGGIGCGPRYVQLVYKPAVYNYRATPVKVGVFTLADERPGWPPNAAIRTYYGLLSVTHAEDDHPVSEIITRAIRAELAAAGMQVSDSGDFNRVPGDKAVAIGRRAGVHHVLVGRINYFGYVCPAKADRVVRDSVTFNGHASTGKAYTDIDLWLVDTQTARVVWARTVRKKVVGDLRKQDELVNAWLPSILRRGLIEVLWQADFLKAVGATVASTPTASARQASRWPQDALVCVQPSRAGGRPNTAMVTYLQIAVHVVGFGHVRARRSRQATPQTVDVRCDPRGRILGG